MDRIPGSQDSRGVDGPHSGAASGAPAGASAGAPTSDPSRHDAQVSFSHLFNRAIAACAQAQTLSSRSAEAASQARAARASARRVRALVNETRAAWADASLVYAEMRGEVERVARTLRASGVDKSAASATVRAHIRFVLYDGGLTERDAEPIVERASNWVEMVYAAA